MTVLKGEGTHVILYGTYTLPSSRMVPAYFARPDRAGSYPTVAVAHDAAGITSGAKAVCRHLARHGFSVICPDLYRGRSSAGGFEGISDRRAAADLADVFDFSGRPGTEWASPDRSALLGLGEGGRFALAASGEHEVDAVALVDAPLGSSDHRPALGLGSVAAPVLGLYGGDGEPGSSAREAGGSLAAGEIVLYRGAGAGFMDDGSGGYSREAAEDALDRLVAFFTSHLSGGPVD